ncbi:hypothetical protein EDD17DRAFT_1564979 [Pisolithus thermaeus]|nr:hypothetical protein EDD17DRAFT_1564979 [Pisolithus thermaeus]
MGRTPNNDLLSLGLKDQYRETIDKLGLYMGDLIDQERDTSLENGDLGRFIQLVILICLAPKNCRFGNTTRVTSTVFSSAARFARPVAGASEPVEDSWSRRTVREPILQRGSK